MTGKDGRTSRRIWRALARVWVGAALLATLGSSAARADMDEDLLALPKYAPTTTVPVIASRRPEQVPRGDLAHAQVVLRSNIYRDGLDHGVPAEVMASVVRLFAHSVDFQRDIQPGDSFEIYFRRDRDPETDEVRIGPIVFAAVTFAGRTLSLWRYTTRDGRTEYFDSEGNSGRLNLMRSPVEGAELTSKFGLRRHPILKYTRMHRGIDFAAHKGTPVYAAGTGTIAEAKRNGSYGNYIRIHHNERYQTAYGHLLRYAKGIRSGGRVRQGQVIGYVGSTGRSTGPHLHFEVFRDNAQIDPATLHLPPARTLSGDELAAFRWYAALLDIRPTVQPVAIRDHPGVR